MWCHVVWRLRWRTLGGFCSTGQVDCGFSLVAVRMGMFVNMQITSLCTFADTLQKHSKQWWNVTFSNIPPTHYPGFLCMSWFSRTEPGSHTLYPVRHWHTIINTRSHTDFITSSLIRFHGISAFMGAWKPHHSCGMSLPMCSVRPGREEALWDNITGENSLVSIKCHIGHYK